MTFSFFGSKKPAEENDVTTFQKAQRSLDEGRACLTNQAAAVQFRMKALSSKCAESASFLHQVLNLREKKLPPDHPNLGAALLALAIIKEIEGKEAEAEEYSKRAIEILQPVKDNVNDPDIAACLQKLCDSGKLLRMDGPLDTVERWHQRAMRLSEQVLPPQHPTTLQSMFDLAVTTDLQGKNEAASQLYERIFVGQANHVPVSGFLTNLASAYQQLGRTVEADRMFRRALDIRARATGATDLDLLPLLQIYSEFAATCADHATESALLLRALSITEVARGGEDQLTTGIMMKCAIALMRAENFDKAVPLFEKALSIREPVLGSKSLQFARELRCLAGTYAMLERYEQAERAFARALEILEGAEEADNAEVIDVGTNCAAMLCEQDKLEEAVPLIRRLLERSSATLGAQSQPTETLNIILQEVMSARDSAR